MTDRQFYGDRICIEVPRSRGEGLRLFAYPHEEPIATQIFELCGNRPSLQFFKNHVA